MPYELITLVYRPKAQTQGPVVAVTDSGREDPFLAWTIRGVAYVEDVEPMAAQVVFELVAFARAQARG